MNSAALVPAGIRRSSTYLPELESLRGLAIGLVVVFHADGTVLFPFANRIGSRPAPPLAFVYAGHTGVTLFFILSAFLLALPFLQESLGGQRVSRPQFYARRALRILPLYYLAVLVGSVLSAKTLADLWRGVPYLLFLEAHPNLVTPLIPWSAVWWSLATEVQFYAVLPLVALACGRSRPTTLALLGLYLIVYLGLARGWVRPGMDPWVRAMSIIGRGPVFLCGILAAWLWLRHGEQLRARFAATRWLAAGGGDVLLLLVLLALGLLLRWTTIYGFGALEMTVYHQWHVPEGILWTLVVLIVLLVPLRTKVLFSNAALARLGIVSYSIYVLHVPILHYGLAAWRSTFPSAGMGWTPVMTVGVVLAAALCCALASVTYWFVERPFLVRKARLDSGAPAAQATE